LGRIKTNEDILYYTGWALLILAGLFVFSVEVLGFRIPGGCLFHLVTGFYCPGCGGTRAVKAMLTGHFLKSLCYHPAVLPTAVLYLAFMGSHTAARVCKSGKINGMKFRFLYLYILGGLVVLNVIIKNI
jgi:hypothetical protein